MIIGSNKAQVVMHAYCIFSSYFWTGGVKCVSPLALNAQRQCVAVHSYTDDTQLYASCSATDGSTLAAQLLLCVTDIADWMTSNYLKLNAEKTQFIWLSSSYYTISVSSLLAALLYFQMTLYRTLA